MFQTNTRLTNNPRDTYDTILMVNIISETNITFFENLLQDLGKSGSVVNASGNCQLGLTDGWREVFYEGLLVFCCL